MNNKQETLNLILSDLYNDNVYDLMTAVLNHFQEINDLEHMCALESQMDGNYNNETQLQWLKNFSAIWEKWEKVDALPVIPDDKKLESAIGEIKMYLDFWTDPKKRPREQKHLCFALEWLEELQTKEDKLERRESSIGRWDELHPHSQELVRNLVNHLASVGGLTI